MELKTVALVITDISGYSEFVKFHKTSLLHAEEIISQLLEAVIDKADHPLTLNKLEGDAALLYAELGGAEEAGVRDVVRQVQTFFTAFRAKIQDLSDCRMKCRCDACQQILGLKLKAILHKGEVAFKKIRQFDELAGQEVILAHRLLKNTVPSHEYILMTEPVYVLIGELAQSREELREEHYKGLDPVRIKVFYPVAGG
jgi:class 3 adenylate cyclase